MAIPRLILPIILLMGYCSGGGELRGQEPAREAARLQEPSAGTDGGTGSTGQPELDRAVEEVRELGQAQARTQQAGGPGPGPVPGPSQEIDRLKAQVELQQKQIDVLLRMTQLLADQVKKPPSGAAVETLQEQAATLEARTQQAAQRDQELARTRDDLLERMDSHLRSGSWLPATARELFLPSRTNESPLAIYGSVAQAFGAFSQQNTSFRAQVLDLRPYLLLNERWLMSANVSLQINTVQLWRAQLEYFLNDHLTVVAGRFYSPIGFFSDRLRLNWVIKTPDPPLMFNQVYPLQLSFDGLQLRGARYLFDWPVKLEYSGFVANGLSVSGSQLSPATYSNLNNFSDTINDVNGAKAWGGRVGLSVPKIGVIVGVSGLANQAYDQANHNLNLWDVDASFHRGNWDARFEYANTDQETPARPIHRQGLYAQVAYRQYNNPHPVLRKLEGVFRFDHVNFQGINIQQTGLNFGGLGLNYARMPLDRNRYTVGANYWFYPSLVLKLALEFYDELGVPSLRDNGFIGQLVWGW